MWELVFWWMKVGGHGFEGVAIVVTMVVVKVLEPGVEGQGYVGIVCWADMVL